MTLRTLRGAALPLTLGLVLLAGAACSSGGGGGGGNGGKAGGLNLVACSLGCDQTPTTGQFTCQITKVFTNQELRFTFDQPIDINTVSHNSFSIVDLNSGKTPPATFRIDSADPKVLIYRPEITFDSSGNPVFGLTQNAFYRLRISGANHDSGPYVRSLSGDPLMNKVECTLQASRGVQDASPGNPDHVMTVTRVETYDPDDHPETFAEVPARGALRVWRQSPVKIVFDDLMNPATLVNRVSGLSSTITVNVDPDGNTADASDQVPVDGRFTIGLDQDALVTTVIFEPTVGYPSAGSDPLVPRRIAVRLDASIADLGGNTLTQPGTISFVPEKIDFPIVAVEEPFDVRSFEDVTHGGNDWGGGLLMPGPGGGSGRLGDLVIAAGQIATLHTDTEDFSDPLLQDPTVFNISNVLDVGDPSTFTVDGGVFEFARLVVEAGATLRIIGPNPARIYARGEFILQGNLDVSARGSVIHDPTSFSGGMANTPGPAGGLGGEGGQRPDGEAFDPALDNPNDPGPVDPSDPAQYLLVNGQQGEGIVYPTLLDPMERRAAGEGGLAWPQPMALAPPYDQIRFPADPTDAFTYPYDPRLNCIVNAPGGVGSGGAYAFSGLGGRNFFVGITLPPIVPSVPGGDSLALGLDATARTLDPDLGYLRGGSGGGGGGGHIYGTRVNGQVLVTCTTGLSGALVVQEFVPYSGAGGGSGGGAVQLQSGRRTFLNGTIDASGGNGAGTVGGTLAQPGGGGSGGSILLQGPSVQIQAIPGRIDLGGGKGGVGFDTRSPATGKAVGGDGGPGLLRIETFDPVPTVVGEATKVIPTDATLKASYGSAAKTADLVSTALWTADGEGVSGFSGTQSCWFSDRNLSDPDNPDEPITNFFELVFLPDDGSDLGWDMQVRLEGFVDPQSWRGENELTGPGGMTLEELYGNQFGLAPLVVRFQGAKSTAFLSQPCSVAIAGVESPFVSGSVSGWVAHPTELGAFFADPALAPNVFRFQVIWDENWYADTMSTLPVIEAVDEVSVRLRPD